MELTSEHIRYELRDHIALITMDRPEKLNALSVAISADLRTAFAEAEADSSVRCVLITGAGRGFSTGEDVRDLRAQVEERAALAASGSGIKEIPMPKAGSPLPRFILQAVSKPVVAAVNGRPPDKPPRRLLPLRAAAARPAPTPAGPRRGTPDGLPVRVHGSRGSGTEGRRARPGSR